MENVMGKMTKLQHLYLPDKLAESVGGNKLILDKSVNLEILKNYNPTYYQIEDLMKFTNLRKFSAEVNSNQPKATKEIVSYLSSNNAINMRQASLVLRNCGFQRETWQIILRQVFQSSRLHILFIYGRISVELPRYNNNTTLSSRLTQLSLIGSKLEEDPMPTLEALPDLLTLTLNNAFIGTEMNCSSNGFPKLRSLKILHMDSFHFLKIEDGAMPTLSNLHLSAYKTIVTLSDGLRFHNTLQTLKNWRFEFPNRLKPVRVSNIDHQIGSEPRYYD